MIDELLQRLRNGHLADVQGTNLAIELPISVRLLQEVLDARPPGGPLKELSIRLLSKNRAILSIGAEAPFVGLVRRELSLHLSGAYDRNEGGLIILDIVDGLKLIDKPIISLLQSQVDSKLPAGVDLNAERIVIDPVKLIHGLGHGYLLQLLAGGKIETRSDQLIIFAHLKA